MGKLDLYDWLLTQQKILRKQVSDDYNVKIQARLKFMEETYHIQEEAERIYKLSMELYNGHLEFCKQFDCSYAPKDNPNDYPFYEMNGYGGVLYTLSSNQVGLTNSVRSIKDSIICRISWKDKEYMQLNKECREALENINREYNKLLSICKTIKSPNKLLQYLVDTGFDKETVSQFLKRKSDSELTALAVPLNANFLMPKIQNQEDKNE